MRTCSLQPEQRCFQGAGLLIALCVGVAEPAASTKEGTGPQGPAEDQRPFLPWV